jgi:hypothetical protein
MADEEMYSTKKIKIIEELGEGMVSGPIQFSTFSLELK